MKPYIKTNSLPVLKLLRQVILLPALLLFSLMAVAIDPPQHLCAEVGSSGEVTLHWGQPEDPSAEFYSYVVYVIDLATGDPLELTEITNYNTTNYTHPAVQADAQNISRTYFLSIRSGDGTVESEYSPQVHTMLLDVTAGSAGALAFLSWNPPYDTLPESVAGEYEIYIEHGPGNWVLTGSAPYGDESYVDTVQGGIFCYDPPQLINYRITYFDSLNCTSISSVDGDMLTDGTGPTPPEIETVTVDSVSGHLIIHWYPSPENDTHGYIVQDNTFGTYMNVGNLNVPATSFTHTVTPSEARQYLVIAYDSCSNDESFNSAHESMYLQVQLRECEQEVDLAWTPYVGWEEGVLMYEIHASENGGEFEILHTNSPGNLNFTTAVNPFSEYCFRIVAYSNGAQRPSVSNTFCQEITYPQTPEYVYLNRVSVTADNFIEINLLADDSAYQMDYRVERMAENEDDFEEVGVMQPTGAPDEYVFVDSDVSPGEIVYQYRVAATDYCQNFFGYSNISHNMLLLASPNIEDFINQVQWNPYGTWNGEVSQYRIFRALGRDGAFEPITTLTGGYFEDNVFDMIDTHGEFCYYIEAHENLNDFNRADTVRSNISCAVQEPLLWIPNAFVVGGYNEIFKPVAGYIDFDRYKMQIFNRWGKLVFESNDIHTGWDGSHNGSVAQEGAYVYVISFTAGNGQTIEETGSVILLKGGN